MKRDTFIFDCDGVLIDTEFLYAQIFSDALSTIGIHKTAQSCFRDLCGLPLVQCYQQIEQSYQRRLPNNFSDTVQQMTNEALEKDLSPTPGIEAVLQCLYESNVPMCVASNGRTDRVQNTLRLAKLEQYFLPELVFGVDQVKRAKPAPDIYLHAANSMRTKADACYVVEDSEVGVKAALASGAYVFHYAINLEEDKQEEERLTRFRSFDWLLNYISEELFKD